MYISSQNLFSSLRLSVQQTQSSLSTLQTEETTGNYADLALQLGGQTGATISVAQQSSHLTALATSNQVVSTRLSTTDSTISDIITDAQSLSNALIANGSATSIAPSTQTLAQFNLQSLISKLNTSVGGQYIFGGINTTQAPAADYDTTLSNSDAALTADLGSDPSQATATQINDAIASTGNFGALFSPPDAKALTKASPTTLTSQISPQQSISTSVSATKAAFQQITQAYALLSSLGGKSLSQTTSQAVVSAATTLLSTGLAGLTTVQSNIGAAQNTVSAANDHITAQQNILTANVSDAENVDPYTLSTKLTSLTNQLQVAYSLTNQIKSLSLVNYLTAG